jgi:ribosomal protein S18 acetylase RimI-like enzyme
VTIRPARAADAPALYDICLRTGADGDDATDRYADPRLLAEVYVGPYLALEPDLAFVVADDAVGGYVLGVRDTADFERRAEESWWPPLRERYPLDSAAQGGADADAGIIRMLHRPHRADPAVLARFPSHLHVDLLPEWQGGGWGRRLLETLFAALADAGSPGVHLGVSRSNERAVAFYRRMGFTELDRDAGGLTMGRSLTEG